MGAVGKVVGSVAGGVGGFLVGGPAGAAAGAGLGGGLLGGNKSAVQGSNYGKITNPEQQRLAEVEQAINQMFSQQDAAGNKSLAQSGEIQDLFANNLKDFLTSGQTNPQYLKQASNFIDQTFTNPAQAVVDQNVGNYEAQAQARAASLGRSPNADVATQQAIAGEAMRQNLGLQAERGSRIQQNVMDRLSAGSQGAGFLNGLGQQAFNNRLQLLNGRTGLADFYQKDRGRTTTNMPSTSPGLFGNISGALGQVAGIQQGLGQLGGLGGFSGGGSSGGSPYLSSNSNSFANSGRFSL